MDYRRDVQGEKPVYRFSGRWTFKDHGQVAAISDDIKGTRVGTCVFDLSDVDFIDSAGLGMLLMAQQTAQKGETGIVLRGMSAQVRSIMKLAKFERVFTIEDG